ncbi:hypothetical protein ACFQJD_18890 [Haloplanus sp. GCM10025708]|uniref:hypothetical protein n=1 Tax=Haloferacaceae TaxID=1644056 RepID=UPI00361BCC2B
MTRTRLQSGFVTVLLVCSLVGTFAAPATATAGSVTVADVGTGQGSVTQTVSVVGRSTDGETPNRYVVDVAAAVDQGAAVRDVAFENAGDDVLERGPEYHADDGTVTLSVGEGDGGDDRVTFDVTLTLDTDRATPAGGLEYAVRQYDTAREENERGSWNARFDLLGTTALDVASTNASADAGVVTHTFSFEMTGATTAERIAVDTPGADYSNVEGRDVNLTVGGEEVAVDSVSGADGSLTVALDGASLDDGEAVTLDVDDARNPTRSIKSRVSVGDGPHAFTGSDAMVIREPSDDPDGPPVWNTTDESSADASTDGVASVEEFGLRSSDGDVTLVLATTEPLENVSVDVSGEHDTTLVRSNFKLEQRGGVFRYTAAVDTGTWGTYVAELRRGRSIDGDELGGGQRAKITVTPPDVGRFELVASGRDVDLVVRLGSPVESATVRMGGGAVGTLDLSEFTRRRNGSQYVYRADVVTGYNGRFEASLTSLNGLSTGDGAVASDALTVDVVSASANATPSAPNATASHRYTVKVPPGANVTRNPLTSLAVSYSDSFRAADGRISPVNRSDVTLQVVSVNGTTTLDGANGLATTLDDGVLTVSSPGSIGRCARRSTPAIGSRSRSVRSGTPTNGGRTPSNSGSSTARADGRTPSCSST